MKPGLTRTLMHFSFLFATAIGRGQAHTITYEWPASPCAQQISCAGLTACNMQNESDAVFFSTGATFNGLAVCPQPTTGNDTELRLDGWAWTPDPTVAIDIAGIALVPVRIDSIIIKYRSGETDGPRRMVARFVDRTDGSGAFRDVLSSALPCSTVLTEVGVVDLPAGGGYGSFYLRIQAYEGNGGYWALDEVRIVATTTQVHPTGITELIATGVLSREQVVSDALGRSVAPNAAGGLLIGNRTVVVLP